MNIVLTGFMGTGKTTVGRLLAQALGYGFVDTDQWIVEKIGQSVTEIFEEKGEVFFREMETAAAKALLGETGVVVATGGKFLLDPENEALLTRQSRVFCLTATPEVILQRIKADKGARRPLLTAPDPLKQIKSLLDARKAGYSRFPQIDTSARSPRAVAACILEKPGMAGKVLPH